MSIHVPDLKGLTVLVTRPAHQARALCEAIGAAGGKAVPFPALEIADPPDLAALDALLDELDRFDIAIFISANAVEKAMPRILARGEFPSHIQIAAVGEKTAQALSAYNLPVMLRPRENYDSEGLLALSELHAVRGKRIVIFRGVGGRELLAEVLQARGAEVAYAECYQRARPALDGSDLPQQGIDIAVVTSNEGLENLFAMVGAAARPWLCATPMVVMSERMRDCARARGVTAPVLVVEEASDAGLLAQLKHYAGNRT